MPPPTQTLTSARREFSAADRERLCEQVGLAGAAVAPNWPMRTFASRSPLGDLEHLPFDEATRRAQELSGGRGYLFNDEYRGLYAQGRITADGLQRALPTAAIPKAAHSIVRVGARTVERSEVLLLHLLYGFEGTNPEALHWQVGHEAATRHFRKDVPIDSRKRVMAHTSETTVVASLWTSTLTTLGLEDPFLPSQAATFPVDPPDTAIPSAAANPTRVATDLQQTMSEWVSDLTGIDVVEQINQQMIKWSSAFLDEGLADWRMPSREQGFYAAWQDLARRDFSGVFMGIKDFRRKVREHPPRPEDALADSLHRLDIPNEQWTDYLARHVAHLPGWAGFIRWRGDNPEYPWQARYPITPIQYLAVRLFYEVELVQVICQREWGIAGTVTALAVYVREQTTAHPPSTDGNMERVCRDAWRLFHLAQFLELSPDDVHALSIKDAQILLGWLESFPADRHGPVWLSAYEDRYRRQLIEAISTNRPEPSTHKPEPSPPKRPRAQAAFCIDVRSEPLRRHLEAQGGYETIGYAGFFGVVMHFRALACDEALPLCPVIVSATQFTAEVPRMGHEQSTRRFLVGLRWNHLGRHLFHALKSHPVTSYILIDLLGPLFGLAFVGKMAVQEPYRRLQQWFHTWLVPPIETKIPFETLPETRQESLSAYGFTLQEQAQTVENGFRLMGLTKTFARLVLLCGHGSTTDNNPYAAALDCGACGGNHGGPNARVLAAMANSPDVRAELRTRGLEVPDDTWFLAGEHDTTTDRVTFLDREELPETHHPDLLQLAKDLEQAGLQATMERCRRLPGAPDNPTPQAAARHVRRRSADWSQVRPEWGLAGNAAFIIGKRTLTAGIDLEGRTFLHNYDADADESAKVLETIMTAPLVVAEWINLQYYFSAVDPWAYGSGSKVLHNVVGGIGVMLGSQSDLQTGFPLQTVNNGAIHYHEPMRLLAIIQAPEERISGVIHQHTVLQRFFDHQWVHLMALHPQTGAFTHYQPGGRWETVSVKGPASRVDGNETGNT